MRSLKPWLRITDLRQELTPAAKGFTIPVKPE